MIVGGGDDFEQLLNLSCQLEIDQHTIFTGRISAEEIPAYYYISDVSVDPVFDNSVAKARCPIKMFESWACGVPFVTGDVGDRKRLLGSPPAGLLITPGDSEALADAIILLLNHPKMAQDLILKGFNRVKIYSWENHAKKFLEICALLIQSEPG